MPINKSIGIRIFGLAIFLLALTIALVGFLLWQVANLNGELQILASRDIPLADSLSRLDEYGLRKRLAFERMNGALNVTPPNAQIMTEAQADFDLYVNKLHDEFGTAYKLLGSNDEDAGGKGEFAGFTVLLGQLEAAYVPLTARQREVITLQRAGDHERAGMLLESLNDMQLLVQTQRAELQNGSAERVEAISRNALGLQSRITYLAVAATASTVSLGLLVALWVTLGLVRPVRSLIGAMNEVQQGRLDLELPVQSSDEIGALTASFNYFVSELRAKAEIRETFGKYVDPRILARMLDHTGAVERGGERQTMTVSFGDLVGFTGSSERFTPATMVRTLNRHFGLQATAIMEHEGIVDKFIGDAVMSFWGPPFVASTEHSLMSCRAALAQIAALEILRQELPELTGLRRDAPGIDMRIGVAAGEVIVGNIGSEHSQSYTVIGDTVNVASRIEAANRFYGTRILVSDTVARDVSQEFELREVDAIAVKGKTEPVGVFELLGATGCLSPALKRACDFYASGLRDYRAGAWDAAQSAFEQSLANRPDDRAAKVMLERIVTLRTAPPNGAWNGIWKMESKGSE